MTDKQIKEAYKKTLDEIEKNLIAIYSPLYNLEKYVSNNEKGRIKQEIKNMCNGYKEMRYSITNIRFLKGVK